MSYIIAKNLLLDKTCDTCIHLCFEDSERIDIEYCVKNNSYTQLPEQRTCIDWKELESDKK